VRLCHAISLLGDRQDGGEREDDVADLVAGATKDTLCALMECVLSTRGTMTKTAANHLRATIAAAMPNLQDPTSAVVLTQTLLPLLEPDYVCFTSQVSPKFNLELELELELESQSLVRPLVSRPIFILRLAKQIQRHDIIILAFSKSLRHGEN
jgi:hypothetical protein